jgi:YHS domain-containing protein
MKTLVTALCASFLLLGPTAARAADKPAAGKVEAAKAAKVFSAPQKEGVKATCPVMGSEFVIDKDTLHSEVKGKHVYFCCPGCKAKFDKEPAKYMK